MSLTREDLLSKIETLNIHEKDYTTILSLLNEGNDELFAKILEEVLNGNLYWSDFEKNISNTGYGELVKTNIKNQSELEGEFSKLISLRRSVNENYNYESDNTNQSRLTIRKSNSDFYNEEEENIKKSLLFELTKINSDDNPIVTAYKIKLYNSIKNYTSKYDIVDYNAEELIKSNQTLTISDDFIQKYLFKTYEVTEDTSPEINKGAIVQKYYKKER